jgi:hypothetical protein
MPNDSEIEATIHPVDGKASGAAATFPYDRLTIERFREAFPRARWRDDLKAWFVPGKTAERRLDKWLGRELDGVLAYADERGRDAFAFDPIASPYLEAADDLRVRTPYSRTVVEEMREVPWAWWDEETRAWRIPYRAFEALRRHWPRIEAAARHAEPEERRRRREARRGSDEHRERLAEAAERRRRRHPVSPDAQPPIGRPVMTRRGAIVVTEVTGECVESDIAARYYPECAGDAGRGLVWAAWRRPTLAELVATWPSRAGPDPEERARGWWQPSLAELREERRKARSIERRMARVKAAPSPEEQQAEEGRASASALGGDR